MEKNAPITASAASASGKGQKEKKAHALLLFFHRLFMERASPVSIRRVATRKLCRVGRGPSARKAVAIRFA